LKRIDTHSHPNMSKHFKFAPVSVDRMVRMARRVGLDGFALTEHFHATDFWAVHEHLERRYPVEGGVFWADDLALIPGAEINIREGAHVIVLGEVSELRRLDRAFAQPLSHRYEPTFREFLDVSDYFDVARIGAHMFRRTKELGKFRIDDLPAARPRGQRQGLRHRGDAARPGARARLAHRRRERRPSLAPARRSPHARTPGRDPGRHGVEVDQRGLDGLRDIPLYSAPRQGRQVPEKNYETITKMLRTSDRRWHIAACSVGCQYLIAP
jgi:hypothetical protein